jgi:hypothetical protein
VDDRRTVSSSLAALVHPAGRARMGQCSRELRPGPSAAAPHLAGGQAAPGNGCSEGAWSGPRVRDRRVRESVRGRDLGVRCEPDHGS